MFIRKVSVLLHATFHTLDRCSQLNRWQILTFTLILKTKYSKF